MSVKTLASEREKIKEKHKWNLEDIFASYDDWNSEKKNLKARIENAGQFKGKLATSALHLVEALTYIDELSKDLGRLHSYAAMASDEDTRVTKYQGMKQESQQIYSEFAAKVSFVEPEILSMDQETIKKFIGEEQSLEPFDFYLLDLMRKKEHRNSEEVEKVIAQSSLISGNASSIYSVFFNADFPFPTITLANDDSVKLNFANFALHRASENRADRKLVFETFFNKIGEFERTFGTQLYGNLKKDLFYSKVRNYNSTLESALDSDNIPTGVYHNLISNVNKNLDTFHRYLGLRKKMMSLDSLHYYDLYAPLVNEVDLKYSVEEANKLVVDSLSPLGGQYTDVVTHAFENQWIDMYPNEGKRSGAYSNGSVYDVHPYILMNFNGKYDDVSTLTHELGHTMHSYLTNNAQPHSKANYSIFVAEVASTLNEALLNDHLLSNLEDPKVRLSILGNYLEGAKGTLFRQTQFAEFELKVHELVEAGEALTGDRFSKLYMELVRKYYGHEEGICKVNDYIQYEWAYIPHFYYNYYVFQYATSFTASQALAEKVLSGKEENVKQYLDFLSSGGSAYPIDLLKNAGVDMESNEPFELTIRKMNKVMDEIEEILLNN